MQLLIARIRKSILKVCIDRVVPGESPFELLGHAERARAAAMRNKMWEPTGRTLRVRFLDGDPFVQKKVAKFAQEWTKFANLKLNFGNDPQAEIRVSFRQPGSWSYIGTDALDPKLPPDQPTLNLGWLTKATRNDEVMRVVLHEFGHALGLIHEHQNPAAAIPWNKAALYDFYKGPPNFWTPEQVEINLLQVYDKEATQYSEFDPHSIMLYPIPKQFTTNDFEVGWNSALSELDKQFAHEWYP